MTGFYAPGEQIATTTLTLPPGAVQVGRALREWRERRGWSQEDVAQQMRASGFHGWRQTFVSKTESGSRPLLFVEAVALCRVLRIKLDALAVES